MPLLKNKKDNHLIAECDHHKITGDKIYFDGIKILYHSDFDPKIKTKEILRIVKKKPTLNTHSHILDKIQK